MHCTDKNRTYILMHTKRHYFVYIFTQRICPHNNEQRENNISAIKQRDRESQEKGYEMLDYQATT